MKLIGSGYYSCHINTILVVPLKLPYYTIIIPTHGRPELLRRSIASIRANDFKDVEIIVISDEVNSATFQVAAELLTQYDMFIKRTGPNGPAGSRNIGLSHAKGQRIIFLDDDDAILPTYLMEAKAWCDKHPDKVLYVNYRVIQEDRENNGAPTLTTDLTVGNQPLQSVYIKNFIHNHTCLYPLQSVKGRLQDGHLASLDDWDFLLNVLSEVDFQYVDISGPVIYKDYVNMGNRRGSSAEAQGNKAVLDYLHIYRRWPAPTPELKAERQKLLSSVGLTVPIDWL